jgi:alginate O-acetyltransferase complex protein AlgI
MEKILDIMFNLIIVWFLTGLWHGASWNFILWGLYYGVLVIAERLFLGKLLGRMPGVVSHIYLIAAVLAGWVFFYYTDLGTAVKYLGVMFGIGGSGFADSQLYIYFINNGAFYIMAIIACVPLSGLIKSKVSKLSFGNRPGLVYSNWIRPLVNAAIMAASTILLIGRTYNPFLYFRF